MGWVEKYEARDTRVWAACSTERLIRRCDSEKCDSEECDSEKCDSERCDSEECDSERCEWGVWDLIIGS